MMKTKIVTDFELNQLYFQINQLTKSIQDINLRLSNMNCVNSVKKVRKVQKQTLFSRLFGVKNGK